MLQPTLIMTTIPIRLSLILLTTIVVTGRNTARSGGNRLHDGDNTTAVGITATSTEEDECHRLINCHSCSARNDCVWCDGTKVCKLVPTSHFLPINRDCKSPGALSQGVSLGLCSMDVKTLAITVTVAGLILLIVISCCLVKLCRCLSDCLYYLFCCCCCSNGESRSAERRLKRIEKQLDRQSRRHELMLKLGLRSNMPYGATKEYSRFQDTSM